MESKGKSQHWRFLSQSECYCLKKTTNVISKRDFYFDSRVRSFSTKWGGNWKIEIEHLANDNLSSIERWCNDFSFHFLAGDLANKLEKIQSAGPQHDYHFELIEQISRKTHLSQIALFTRLLLDRKISPSNYSNVKSEFEEAFKERQAELQRVRELEKVQGKQQRGSAPQPIKSPLLVSTIQTAFYEGVLNEYEVCKRLNIKPDKLEKYIQWS